jgi:proline iminopeptidase
MRRIISEFAILATLVSTLFGTTAFCLSPGEGFIDVPGGKVWYRIVGSGPKTPLLILHGGPGAPSYYLKPLAALADERPVIFYDQLGCGHSPSPVDTSMWHTERFVAELAKVREASGLKEVHMLGTSWGTMLAVEYMLTKPKGVKSLILSGPSLSIARWVHDADSLKKTMPDSIQVIINNAEKNGDFDSPAYQTAMAIYYQKYLARKLPWSADIDSTFSQLGMSVYLTMCGPSEFSITGNLKNFDDTKRLKEIKVPTLFTAGEFDEATPAAARYYQSMMPGSKLAIIKDAAHLSMDDEPKQYNKVVRDFLHSVE